MCTLVLYTCGESFWRECYYSDRVWSDGILGENWLMLSNSAQWNDMYILHVHVYNYIVCA